jgi:hypothetical protein
MTQANFSKAINLLFVYEMNTARRQTKYDKKLLRMGLVVFIITNDEAQTHFVTEIAF